MVEKTIDKKAIHPEWRTEFSPNNSVAFQNPPALIAPTARDEWKMPYVLHDFQLARDAAFKDVIADESDVKSSFFIPSVPLSNGTWYWRVRENDGAWHGPFSFVVNEEVWVNTAPPASVFVEGVTQERPRVLARKARLEQLRTELKGSDMYDAFVKGAETYMDVELPKKEWGGKFYKNGKRVFQNKKFPPEHRKAQPTGRVFAAASHALSLAYVLTGDEAFGREAVRWATRVASFEIVPTHLSEAVYNYQDEFDYAAQMSALVYAYDSCNDLMTAQERVAIRTALVVRTDSYYRYFVNRLECRVMDNHAWQHTYMQFVEAAMALKGDVPEADEYLAYCYDVWRVRHPVLSTFDGGWNNGKYYAVNIGTWITVPVHFQKFTGHNFYDHPWYRNHIAWILYKRPPGSNGDGFGGDGYETSTVGIDAVAALWLNILDAELGSPLARWLASMGKKENPGKRYGMVWPRVSEGLALKSDKPVEKPDALPQSKLFQDTGIVNMNREILNAEDNLMVSLRSAPWGGFGHNLANHNAFNVVYKGESLFVPFRYRHGGGKHHYLDYRHTRGHNSVLVNGKGQPLSSEAFGWIPRFIDGKMIAYACGDASKAYAGTPSPQWHDRVGVAGLDWDELYGVDELKRFRRHVLFVRPKLIVVYDELEASEPVRWDLMLHCRKTLEAKGNALIVDDVARTEFFASQSLTFDVRDEVMVPPFNVDGRGGNPPTVYKSIGTHAYITPKKKSKALRVISFMQVGDILKIEQNEDGSFVCGDWTIVPELDPANAAQLKVKNAVDTVSFVLKDDSGVSVLTEQMEDGREVIKSAVDEVPLAARTL
jgi:hypothetical protein